MKKFILPLILCFFFSGDLSAGMTYRQPKQETDPVFSASEAHSINSTDTSNWNTAFGWGNHAGLYLPIDGEAASVNGLTITPGASISGNNTGDQSANDFDISNLADSQNKVAYWNGKLDDAPTDGGEYVRKSGTWSQVSIPTGTPKRGPTFTFGSGGAVPMVGTIASLTAPYSGTISGWEITEKSSVAGTASSVVVNVYKNGASISGTEKPTLSSQTSNTDTNLTTWTTSFSAGDKIDAVIESASTGTKFVLVLYAEASN